MMKISELRNWARREGIPNFSRMKKSELMEEWENFQPEEPLKIQWRRKIKKTKTKKKSKNPMDWDVPFFLKILKPTIVKVKKTKIPKVISQQKGCLVGISERCGRQMAKKKIQFYVEKNEKTN